MGKIEKLFFFDCETTDLLENDPNAQIIEVACAVLDLSNWQIIDSYETLVWHNANLDKFTATRFEEVDFSDAVQPADAVNACLDIWRRHKATWIGQNPGFDLKFMKCTAYSLDIEWPKYPEVDYHVLDVASMMLPRVIWGEVDSVSLAKTRLWAGCKGDQTHRAMGDALDTIAVFKKIVYRDLKRESQRPPKPARCKVKTTLGVCEGICEPGSLVCEGHEETSRKNPTPADEETLTDGQGRPWKKHQKS